MEQRFRQFRALFFLIFAPFAGVHLEPVQVLLVAVVVFLVSFSLTALGFAIAWPMDSSQAFHGIVNLFLIPLWLLSGALFPLAGASRWIRVIMRTEPADLWSRGLARPTVSRVRRPFPLPSAMATLVLFSLVMFGAGAADGKPPHDEARCVIAEQYAFFPALNATLNGTSAVLLLTGRVLIAKAASPRTAPA